MTTAIAEKPDTEPALSTPDTSILFMARRQDLRLVKVPRYAIRGASGEQIDQTHGEAIQFVNGRFFCPPDGEVELDNGRKVDAAPILEWLTKHKLNGQILEGFWRVDPVAPAPSEAEFQALMDAATEFDEERLQQLVDEERAGWEREAIINAGERAIARIREIKAAATAQAQAEAAAETPAATPDARTTASPAEALAKIAAAEQARSESA